MKKLVFLIAAFFINYTIAYAATQKTMICTLQGMKDNLSFVLPNKAGDLPKVDFPYPVDVTIFHQTANDFLLVAMDHDDHSRPRIFISAQAHKNSHIYQGQFMTDFGGNQIQLDNGLASCKIVNKASA